MEQKDLVGVALQLPVVGLFFWLVGKEIAKLSERVDNQSRLFQELVRDSNAAIREASAINASLKTLIETLVSRCAANELPAEIHVRAKQQ
jgi:hypothetical protein